MTSTNHTAAAPDRRRAIRWLVLALALGAAAAVAGHLEADQKQAPVAAAPALATDCVPGYCPLPPAPLF